MYFSKAAVTNYLQLSGFKQHKCILLQLRRSTFEMDLGAEGTEIRSAGFVSGSSGEGCSLALSSCF